MKSTGVQNVSFTPTVTWIKYFLHTQPTILGPQRTELVLFGRMQTAVQLFGWIRTEIFTKSQMLVTSHHYAVGLLTYLSKSRIQEINSVTFGWSHIFLWLLTIPNAICSVYYVVNCWHITGRAIWSNTNRLFNPPIFSTALDHIHNSTSQHSKLLRPVFLTDHPQWSLIIKYKMCTK